ncbi:hypothetical protein T484DRAFT_1772875, partial [Baffinella frigidus]
DEDEKGAASWRNGGQPDTPDGDDEGKESDDISLPWEKKDSEDGSDTRDGKKGRREDDDRSDSDGTRRIAALYDEEERAHRDPRWPHGGERAEDAGEEEEGDEEEEDDGPGLDELEIPSEAVADGIDTGGMFGHLADEAESPAGVPGAGGAGKSVNPQLAELMRMAQFASKQPMWGPAPRNLPPPKWKAGAGLEGGGGAGFLEAVQEGGVGRAAGGDATGGVAGVVAEQMAENARLGLQQALALSSPETAVKGEGGKQRGA